MFGYSQDEIDTIPDDDGNGHDDTAEAPSPIPGAYVGPFANRSFAGEPFAFWLAVVFLLVAGKFVSEHKATPGIPANLRVNLYNTLAVTFTAILGIVGLKMLTARFPVPGLSQLIATV